MHRLLYYPNFEIQDQNFLKFALLYIDEIKPIIPERAKESLSDSMRNILRNTELINPYSPNYENGYLASIATIRYLEEKGLFAKYGEGLQRGNCVTHNYTFLRHPNNINRRKMDRLGTIQREIQFYVPTDMYRIPLSEFINLRSDHKFETTRRNFVT